DTGESVRFGWIVSRAQLQHHLLLGPQIEDLAVPPALQIPHMQLMTVLSGEEQLGVRAVLVHVGSAPLAGDHRVAAQMPPEIVGQILWAAIQFPTPADLKRLRVQDENAAGAFTLRRSKRVKVDAIGPAVRSVRPAVTRAPNDCLRLNHPGDLR